jgi:hypothetical protein
MFFTSHPTSFDLVIFVELVFRWIKIGLAKTKKGEIPKQ